MGSQKPDAGVRNMTANGATKRALEALEKSDVVIRNNTYAVFVDETGHEEFKADGQLFGFAGVAGFGSELVRAERKWRAMKSVHFGGENVQLHASTMMTTVQLSAISRFFEDSRLARFAFVLEEPPIEIPLNAIDLLRGFMGDCLLEALGTLTTAPADVIVCFEQSDRLLPKLLKAIPGLKITTDSEAGEAHIPATLLITPKVAGSVHLEMADQVAHRAQRQFKMKDGTIYPEFAAVFPPARPRHAMYRSMRIGSIEKGEWKISFDTPKTARVRWTFRPSVEG